MDAAASEQLLRLVKQEVGSEFEVERELGRGGMAIVYLATEVNLGRKVAIKVLPPDFTFGSAGAIERFKREARTAATLDHPNIIPVYRVSPGGRLFWYAMKYLEGRSLADLLEEQRALSLADSIAILEQVASALDYAHARHVVHRDIKPANIMLDAQNRVIVTDFGIAKQLAAGAFTASGSVIGTPYYMSPEQCQGSKTITGAADQYSVGVMTYQMLSGQVPFEGDSAVDILTKHMLQPPPPLDIIRPGLPKHVYAAIERALAKKPEQRFPSVGAFVRALKESGEPITTPVAPRRSRFDQATTTPVAVSRKRRWSRVLVAAAVTGGGLGAAALLLTRQASSPPAGLTSSRTDTAAPRPATPLPSAGPSTEAATTTVTAAPASPPTATSAGAGPAASPRPSQPTTGRVTILGLPAGGSVFVDGRRRNGSSWELAAGTHTVRFEAPGFQPTGDTAISVPAGGSLRLSFRATPLAPREATPTTPPAQPRQEVTPGAQPAAAAPAVEPGILVVRTVGGWARIYVDGAFRREGTSHRDSLPPGTHTLRLEREGYVTVDTTVTLRGGETRVVTITMRPSGS
jgi:serine/threonine-protein kinase